MDAAVLAGVAPRAAEDDEGPVAGVVWLLLGEVGRAAAVLLLLLLLLLLLRPLPLVDLASEADGGAAVSESDGAGDPTSGAPATLSEKLGVWWAGAPRVVDSVMTDDFLWPRFERSGFSSGC